MRILHLVKKFNFGGAENHVRDLANIMSEMGNDVYVISQPGKQNQLLSSSVKFIPFRMQDIFILFQVPYLVYLLRKHRIDIMHAHQRLPVLMASLAGRLAGIPVIVTVHGQTQHDVRSRYARKIPEKFIYVRQSTFDESPSYGIPSAKAVFIQNGVALSDNHISRDLNAVCYVSRIDKRHGSVISLIINKVLAPLHSRFPEMTFNIVGDGEALPGIRKEADALNQKLKAQVVIVKGYIPDVKEVIRRSGLVLGVGRVAIETLACAVPLISVNYKCLGGLASKENYSYLQMNNFVSLRNDPPDEKRLTEHLSRYLGNKDAWQQEARQLQSEIGRDFNINEIAGRITSLYKEFIDGRS